MKTKLRILHIVGARPNFMKLGPVWMEIDKQSEIFVQRVVHTGQHFDKNMSSVFFNELGIGSPDVNLGISSGTQLSQIANVMLKLEDEIKEFQPDFVFVVGDVNAALAGALASNKLGKKIVHLEAGLRSGDKTMPEEINRLLVDQISDMLLSPSIDAVENLELENIDSSRIKLVGNLMIDSLVRLLPKAEKNSIALLGRLGLRTSEFATVTLHRPSNVDDPETLIQIIQELILLSEEIKLIFPIHPRTLSQMKKCDLEDNLKKSNILLTQPLGYIDFLSLQQHSAFVLTDSGGIQEETTYLDVPCVTLRQNTERPVTVELGSNILIGDDPKNLVSKVQESLMQVKKRIKQPIPYWDGRAASRTIDLFKSAGF